MCIVKTPKISPTDAQAKVPEPTIIRNPYLDGVDPNTRSLRMGRSSLRIERGGGRGAPTPPPVHDTGPSTSPGSAVGTPAPRGRTPSLASRLVTGLIQSQGSGSRLQITPRRSMTDSIIGR